MTERQGILLESGNNELEILEFKVNGSLFGINVAKVAEIICNREITLAPKSAEEVRGIFSLRGKPVSAIDLGRVLFGVDTVLKDRTIFIVTNFNDRNMAFIVDEVSMISRCRWSDISKPDSMVSNTKEGTITGILQDKEKLVCILDFEKIVGDIEKSFITESNTYGQPTDQTMENIRNHYCILVAEDSKMLNQMIVGRLVNAGYRVTTTENGQEAWDLLCACKSKHELLDTYHCLVTDIEMPAMDGLTLSKNIKTSDKCKRLPIIVFSSLVNEALVNKVKSLEIDRMITKPDAELLVDVVDSLVLKRK